MKNILMKLKRLFCLCAVSSSASRHFLFAATFKLDNYETATQNFGHVRKIDFPTITNLKDVVRSYHKKASNIVILSISEVKEDEFKRFFSEQD
jgi:hypothetical protein